jgi:hypothetical protein
VGALFSSEVTLTQEMILWEDGVEHTLDARTGAHLEGGHAGTEDDERDRDTASAVPTAGALPASTPGDR